MVQILEGDPDFRKKLESAKVDEIRDGTIAKELEFINHNVRTKLDEAKRQELEVRCLSQQSYFNHIFSETETFGTEAIREKRGDRQEAFQDSSTS